MGSVQAVEKALKEGADVNMGIDETGWLPVHGAVSSGNAGILDLLLEKKADINARTNVKKRQPIHMAAQEGNVPMLEKLVKLGADIEAKDKQKKRPIHYACEKSLSDVVQFLLDKGADPLTPDLNQCSPYDYTLPEADTQAKQTIQSRMQSMGCAKTGGGTPANSKEPVAGITFTGIVVQVGSDVNKPGTWWWDPEKKMVVQDSRPEGVAHPNLPKKAAA